MHTKSWQEIPNRVRYHTGFRCITSKIGNIWKVCTRLYADPSAQVMFYQRRSYNGYWCCRIHVAGTKLIRLIVNLCFHVQSNSRFVGLYDIWLYNKLQGLDLIWISHLITLGIPIVKIKIIPIKGIHITIGIYRHFVSGSKSLRGVIAICWYNRPQLINAFRWRQVYTSTNSWQLDIFVWIYTCISAFLLIQQLFIECV